ncbi:MAG TPA: SBBP repeat-containing protein [Candidatus Sulfotelmatobacter sp.]|jgi:hypothetical protein
MRVQSIFISALLALAVECVAQVSAPASKRVEYQHLPWNFEENLGQTDPKVQFLSRAKGYTAFLTSDGIVLGLHPAKTAKSPASGHAAREDRRANHTIELRFVGAAANPRAIGEDAQPGRVNYFIGNDPNKWTRNVRIYGKVRYNNIYPGIDLIYYGNHRQLEYDFAVSPHADPNLIEFEVKGAQGIRVDRDGSLLVNVATTQLRLLRPGVYQEVNGRRIPLHAEYVVKDGARVSFRVADFDRARPLVIDPVLAFSSYLGGSGDDQPTGIATDSQGNVYVCGYTDSADFPGGTIGSLPTGSDHVFIAKMDATGSQLVYADYIGGNSQDYGYALALDASSEVYVTGSTASSDFPMVNPYQGTYPGSFNAFLTKLSGDGADLLYSTYLGGNGSDIPSRVAVDSASNVLVAGTTSSTNFPVANAYQSTASPNQGGVYGTYGFLTKFSPDGSSLAFSTYLGGSSNTSFACGATQCWPEPATTLSAMTVDASGNAYLGGTTNTYDFPVSSGAYLTTNTTEQNSTVGFVTKMTSAGALQYSTYFYETFGFVTITGIAADTSGSAYVTGLAFSDGTFPLTSTSICDPNDSTVSCNYAFVAKFDASASTLAYSTFLGPNNYAAPAGIALDANNNAYVLATTSSNSFSPVNGLEPYAGGNDLLLVEIDAAAGSELFATYLGGRGDENATAMAMDSIGNLYLTGTTDSTDLPTTQQAFQTAPGGSTDGFVMKVDFVLTPSFSAAPASLTFASATIGITSSPQQVTIQNTGLGAMDISSVSIAGDFAETNTCGTSVAPGASCSLSVTFTATASGPRTGTVTINDNAAGAPHAIPLSGAGTAAASVSLSPTSLAFAAAVKRSSASQTATLVNEGSSSVSISGVQVTGDFSQANNCPATLTSGSSCTFSVTFAPTVSGSRTGVLTVSDSAVGSPHTVQLSGTGADFSLTGSPQSATVSAGTSGTFTMTTTPVGGAFNNQIQLTCSGAPSGSTCTLSPASVTPGSSTSSAALTITTVARSSGIPAGFPNGIAPTSFFVSLLEVLTIAGLLLGLAGRRGRKALVWLALAPSLLLLASCAGGTGTISSGSKGTQPGNYTITVTGTSGSLKHTSQITLTVQ